MNLREVKPTNFRMKSDSISSDLITIFDCIYFVSENIFAVFLIIHFVGFPFFGMSHEWIWIERSLSRLKQKIEHDCSPVRVTWTKHNVNSANTKTNATTFWAIFSTFDLSISFGLLWFECFLKICRDWYEALIIFVRQFVFVCRLFLFTARRQWWRYNTVSM